MPGSLNATDGPPIIVYAPLSVLTEVPDTVDEEFRYEPEPSTVTPIQG